MDLHLISQHADIPHEMLPHEEGSAKTDTERYSRLLQQSAGKCISFDSLLIATKAYEPL
jgi:hypothetical protein